MSKERILVELKELLELKAGVERMRAELEGFVKRLHDVIGRYYALLDEVETAKEEKGTP